jgi:hypothetical protein
MNEYIQNLKKLAEAATPGFKVSPVRPYDIHVMAFILSANPQTILSLIERIERYEEALKFYADRRHVKTVTTNMEDLISDVEFGDKARDALGVDK